MAEVRVGIFTPVGPFANGAGQRSTIRGYSATGSFLQTAQLTGVGGAFEMRVSSRKRVSTDTR
jgi:hypothetical protein